MRTTCLLACCLGLYLLGAASAVEAADGRHTDSTDVARGTNAFQVGLGRPTGAKSVPSLGRPMVIRAQGADSSMVRTVNYLEPAKDAAAGKPAAAQPAPAQPLANDLAIPAATGVDLCCDTCAGMRGSSGNFYGSVEFLLWRLRDSQTPPLITTSNVGSDVKFAIGAIGSPGTVILFGGEIDHGWRPGTRLTAGYWFDPCQTLGVEGSVFGLEHRAVTYQAGSDGIPPLFRPFFSYSPTLKQPVIGEDAQEVAFPNRLAGTVVASLDTRLWGAEANLRKSLCYGMTRRCTSFSVDLIGGVRYLSLDESLQIDEFLAVTAQTNVGPPVGTRIVLHDEFSTDNRFYGGQVGAHAEFRRGKVFMDVRAKIALGVTHQEVSIDGGGVRTDPSGVVAAVKQGGLLTQPTNIGERDRNVFSVVPEIGVNVGYQFTDGLRVFAGYSFMYWTNVVRPGDQVDRVVNATQILGSPVPFSGPARPAFSWNDTDFWAQGFNLGLEMRY